MSRYAGRFSRFILAGTLAIGSHATWLLLIGILLDLMPGSWYGMDDFEYFFFVSDGTPVIAHQDTHDWSKLSYRDLDGNSVSDPAARRLSGTILPRAAESRGGLPSNLSWSDRIRSFNDFQSPATYWHFVHDGHSDGAGYFIGFNSENNRQVGFIGRNGSLDHTPSRSEQFPLDSAGVRSNNAITVSPYSRPGYDMNVALPGSVASDQIPPWLVYVNAKSELLEVNLRDRTVRVAIEPTSLPVVAVALDYAASDGMTLVAKRLLLRTASEVLVYDSKLELVSTVSLPEQLRSAAWFNYHNFADGRGALRVQRTSAKSPDKTHHSIYWVDRGGTVERTDEFDLQSAPVRFGTLAVAAPGPIFAGLGIAGASAAAQGAAGADDSAAGPGNSLATAMTQFWPALVVIGIGSSILAWLCYRRESQFAVTAKQRFLWTAFVWLLGIPGFIGYYFSRRWPVLDDCPACSQLVPMDRPSCVSCGRTFPAPAPKGIEVFA